VGLEFVGLQGVREFCPVRTEKIIFGFIAQDAECGEQKFEKFIWNKWNSVAIAMG
jgi:hypothetical protein